MRTAFGLVELLLSFSLARLSMLRSTKILHLPIWLGLVGILAYAFFGKELGG
jgi:hypothetical protein